MEEKRIEIPDADPSLRELVAECEVSGRRTRFERDGRPVAILVSWDEYLSLRETIEIAANPEELIAIGRAEDEVRRGAMILAEDLS